MANDSQSKQNDSDVKQGLLAAYRRFMGPLVRILIRNGISFNEFADELKGVFVEVAQDDFPIDDRNPSGTRIAILTGLTRKEVKRQLERLEGIEVDSSSDISRVNRVLAGWYEDKKFTGPYGLPLELSFDISKNGAPSFTELVKRHSGDMSSRAMLDELSRINAVEILPDNSIRALTRTYITPTLNPDAAKRLGRVLVNLAETLDYNWFIESDVSKKRFERTVYTDKGLDPSAMDDFRLLVHEKSQALIDTLDNFISANEIDDKNKNTDSKGIKTGVGVYHYVVDE